MTAVPGLASVLAPGRDVAAITAVVRDAAARTGVDFNFLLAQAKAESGLDPTARARTSSARGLYQFTSGTWLEMVRRHGNEHGLGWAAEMINRRGGPPGFAVDVGVPVPGRPALATHNANGQNQSGKGNLIKTY